MTGNFGKSKGKNAVRDRRKVVYGGTIRCENRLRGRLGRHSFKRVGHAVKEEVNNLAINKSHGSDDSTRQERERVTAERRPGTTTVKTSTAE